MGDRETGVQRDLASLHRALADARRDGAADALERARARVDHEAVTVDDALRILRDMAATP